MSQEHGRQPDTSGTSGGPEPTDVTEPTDPPRDRTADGGTGSGTPAPPSRARQNWRRRWDAVPLTAQLLTILLTLLVVALSVSGYATQGLLRTYLLRQFDRQLVASARAFTGIALDVQTRRDFLVRRSLPGDATVQLWLGGQDVPTTIGSQDQTSWPRLPALSVSLVENHSGTPFTVGSKSGDRLWRVLVQAYPTEGGTVVYSEVALPMDQVTQTLARLRFVVLVLGAILVGACALLGWPAIRGAFVPLREVEDTAAAIAAGDLSQRVRERPRSTEVGRLTASLNGMLTQIEQAFRHREASEARTRRFAADASHELRTPLASIRGFAELYRQGAVPPDEVPRTMRRIEDEATRMGGLVEDLLLLARLDEQRPGRAEVVDLAVLANDAVHDARGLDPTRRVALVGLNGSGGPTPSVVIGDEDRLRQVVANLMANAVRHTPRGTAIEVAVGVAAEPVTLEPVTVGPTTTGAGSTTDTGAGSSTNTGAGSSTTGAGSSTTGGVPWAVLEVRDHGPGLTTEQAERVFERFYRVDASRTRGKGGGNGLGLSIVSAVVAAHHGNVETRTTPGGGATFRIRIPAAPPGSTPA
jgi:two-component system OmpR family sensor kinase